MMHKKQFTFNHIFCPKLIVIFMARAMLMLSFARRRINEHPSTELLNCIDRDNLQKKNENEEQVGKIRFFRR